MNKLCVLLSALIPLVANANSLPTSSVHEPPTKPPLPRSCSSGPHLLLEQWICRKPRLDQPGGLWGWTSWERPLVALWLHSNPKC